MKTALLLLLVSFSVFADYKSEISAITEFEKKEFTNKKNFTPAKPGSIPTINKEFYDRLLAKPQDLKYFLAISNYYQLTEKYRKDKAFALALESKFGGKKMDDSKWEKVAEVLTNNILKDSNADHKKALATPATSKEYFEKNLALLKTATFK